MSATKSVIATYETHGQAEDAIRDLHRFGFSMKQLSIIGKGFHPEEYPVGFYSLGDRMKTWGGVGAFWGALWGMLIGMVYFWIPGFGFPGASGLFIHVLVGAVIGAITVGIIAVLGAALANIGVPDDAIVKYEKIVRVNQYQLIVHGTADEVEEARRIMEQTGTIDTPLYQANGSEISSTGPLAGHSQP
jgi:uncharacterized membrane protein